MLGSPGVVLDGAQGQAEGQIAAWLLGRAHQPLQVGLWGWGCYRGSPPVRSSAPRPPGLPTATAESAGDPAPHAPSPHHSLRARGRQQWRFAGSSPEQGWAPGSTVSNRRRAGFRRVAPRPPARHAFYQKADGLPWPPACSPRKSPGSQVSAETSRLCRSELPAHLRWAERRVRATSQLLDSRPDPCPQAAQRQEGSSPRARACAAAGPPGRTGPHPACQPGAKRGSTGTPGQSPVQPLHRLQRDPRCGPSKRRCQCLWNRPRHLSAG